MNIGKKIFELRKKKQMTQKELAERIGISEQAVSKWEREVASPDLYLIPTLAEIFEVSTDELLGFAPRSPEKDEKPQSQNTQNDQITARVEYLEHLLSMVMAGNSEEAYEDALFRAKPILSFDFTKMTEAERALWKVANAEILESDGKMLMQSKPIPLVIGTWYDPMMTNDKLSIDTEDIKQITVRLKTVSFAPVATLDVFFKTDADLEYVGRKNIACCYKTNKTQDVSIVFSNQFWRGKLTGLRIDPANEEAEYSKIEYIALIGNKCEVKYMFDFTDPDADISDWEFKNATLVDRENGIGVRHIPFDNVRLAHDPWLERDDLDFDIGKSKHVHVRLKTDLDDNPNQYRVNMGVYFKTEASDTYNRPKTMFCTYTAGCGMVDLYVDMSLSPFWRGKLTGLRIDPVEERAGRFEIELVEILEPTSDVRSAGFIRGYDKKIQEMQSRIDELEDMIDDLECRIDDLECQIEDLE